MVRRYAPGEPLWVSVVPVPGSLQHIDARLSQQAKQPAFACAHDQRLHSAGSIPGPRDAGGLVVRCRNADVGVQPLAEAVTR